MKKPWETEDWKKAPGIIQDPTQTNSALAERDYTVECDAPSENLIQIVKGYWIWWCSAHHQPAMWCEKAKTVAAYTNAYLTAQTLREALVEISKGKGAYSMDRLTHAENTIRDMIGLATDVLAKTAPLNDVAEVVAEKKEITP